MGFQYFFLNTRCDTWSCHRILSAKCASWCSGFLLSFLFGIFWATLILAWDSRYQIWTCYDSLKRSRLRWWWRASLTNILMLYSWKVISRIRTPPRKLYKTENWWLEDKQLLLTWSTIRSRWGFGPKNIWPKKKMGCKGFAGVKSPTFWCPRTQVIPSPSSTGIAPWNFTETRWEKINNLPTIIFSGSNVKLRGCNWLVPTFVHISSVFYLRLEPLPVAPLVLSAAPGPCRCLFFKMPIVWCFGKHKRGKSNLKKGNCGNSSFSFIRLFSELWTNLDFRGSSRHVIIFCVEKHLRFLWCFCYLRDVIFTNLRPSL